MMHRRRLVIILRALLLIIVGVPFAFFVALKIWWMALASAAVLMLLNSAITDLSRQRSRVYYLINKDDR